MTISSLQDLNTYAQTPITYDDLRTARVVFDRGATVDQTLVTPENGDFVSPWGINIETITQPDVAEVEYHLDYSAWADPISVTWAYLPAHMTATRTNNTWIVSGIENNEDWLYARNATVLPPFGFSGFVAHSAAIHYYSDNQDSTKNIAGWDIDITVTQVEYFSVPSPLTYVSNTLYSQLNTTRISADPEDFDPVWDLRIYSADANLTPVDAIEEMFSDGSAAEATWNNNLNQYIVTGDTGSINEVLDTIDLETRRYAADFKLVFRLANNFTNDLEYQIQSFASRDMISDPVVATTQTTAPNYIFGAFATPFVGTTTSSTAVTIRRPNSTTLPVIASSTSTPQKVPGDHMSSAGASTIRTNQTVAITNNPTLKNTYPAGVAPTFIVNISINSGDDPTEIYTAGSGGTAVWTDISKTLQITGTQTQVNSHLNSMSIEYDTTMDANVQLRYQTSWDFENQVITNTYQTLTYTPDILNIDLERSYRSGKSNVVFASDIPTTNNADYTTFALTLSVALGDFVYDGTISNSITVTGTSSTLSDLLDDVLYYPDYGQTGDKTITYSITKDGVAGQNGTFNLDYLGAGTFTNGSYGFASAGSATWTPTLEERLYGEMDYAVVGGGGGGSYPGQVTAYDRYDVNTFGTGASRSSSQKKFGTESAYFDGTSDAYIDMPVGWSSALGMFVADFWMRPDNTTQTSTLFDARNNSSSTAFYIRQNNSGIDVYYDGDLQLSGSGLSANTWHHIHVEEYAYDPDGANVRKIALYIDGTRKDITTDTTRAAHTPDYRLGNDYAGSDPYAGYIDEFLNVIGGDDAAYTFNSGATEVTTFTTPTTAWTFNSDDGQLLHFNDVYPAGALISDTNAGYTNSAGGSFGGGGGAVASQTSVLISSNSYSLTVGAGGSGGNGSYDSGAKTYNLHGSAGTSSVFNSTTALGGGGAWAYFDYVNDPYFRQSATYTEFATDIGGGKGGDSGNSNAGRDLTNTQAQNALAGGQGVIGTSGAGSGGSGDSVILSVNNMITLGNNFSWSQTPGAGTTVTLNGVAQTNLGAGGWGATGLVSKLDLDAASISPPTLFFATKTAGTGGHGYNSWLTSSHNGEDGTVIIRTRNR